MTRTLRMVLAGIVSLAAATACQPVQAQTTTYDPVYFAGVAGAPQTMLTTQGASYVFPAGARPTYASILASPFGTSADFAIGGTLDGNQNYDVMTISQLQATTEPTYLSGTVDVSDGTAVIGTQDIHAVVFATVESRDAFLYYLQQQDQSATYSDYVYATAHLNYTFWIGQENQGLALYSLYTGLGDYYYLTTVDQNPQFAAYYYWYYRGLGAYYFYEGQGDLDSANLAFAYYVSLANGSL